MRDGVQEGLAALARGDRGRVVDEALDSLAREWRPRVRRFLRSPGEDEVDDWLADAMIALAVEPHGAGSLRALAPDDVADPAAWRRKVLQRFLIDQARKKGRRRHVEQALKQGLSRTEENRRWEEAKQTRGADAPPSLHDPLGERAGSEPTAVPDQRGMDRRAVFGMVAELPVLRAVVLLLALRADPRPLAEALAEHLDEPAEAVLHRMDRALRSPPDQTHDFLTEPMVRVGWPTGPLSKALDAARKALARARTDVAKRLASRSDP